jgi:hypothetical protein
MVMVRSQAMHHNNHSSTNSHLNNLISTSKRHSSNIQASLNSMQLNQINTASLNSMQLNQTNTVSLSNQCCILVQVSNSSNLK